MSYNIIKNGNLILISNKFSSVFIKQIKDNNYIIVVITTKPDCLNQGHGTGLLKELLKYANRNNLTIYGEIASIGKMSDSALLQWYTKHGFVTIDPLELANIDTELDVIDEAECIKYVPIKEVVGV